jgi:DNA polymerase III epsilon subunit-like protein
MLNVKGRRLVVVDCETNGLYGDVRILSLAMVELRNGIAADSKL